MLGSLTDIDAILPAKTVRDVLDVGQPIAVLLLAVLYVSVDDQHVHAAVDRLKAAPASCAAVDQAVAYAAIGRLP